MSEIKLKQEVIDSIQERIDKECYFVGEEWVISSDEALEIVADVLQKTMERINAIFKERAEKYLGEAKMQKHNRFYNIAKQYEARAYSYIEAMNVVKEEGGIE